MSLVSAKEMLQRARKGHYAVGAFNINNLEWAKCILLAAQKMNSPVILEVSEAQIKYMCGFDTVAGMVRPMIADLGISVPVAFHLDHGSYEGAKKAVAAGFTSVMFDGSKLSFEENLERTGEIAALCHANGMSVEAEVGSIGGQEDGVIGMGECADPEECLTIAKLGIDFLAAGIGNIHGVYPANWPGLRFDVLEHIKEKTKDLPLVLHGGSGIPKDQIKKAVSMGICKVNVNTECGIVFSEATKKYYLADRDMEPVGFDPRAVLKPGMEAVFNKVCDKIRLFGSFDKA